MRTFQSQSDPEQCGVFSSSSNSSSSGGGAMSPLSTASITLAALLILTIPVCTSAPAEVQKTTTDQKQLFSKIEAVCSSYLSADLELWASDALGELCVMMLVQKSKELKLQEKSKRTALLHPLLHLFSQLSARGERGLSMHAEVQGPGGIESRGYFLYRPRNGRRSLEYE
ncbi:neuromedin-U [Pleuronectes platessa]|uniref:neuromedin-U n=1 Tax=Pleuronectes platessa TaxID=8262 RepID=UPI00232A68CC|nr:neuromedin-U [Pleuronectes platessa]